MSSGAIVRLTCAAKGDLRGSKTAVRESSPFQPGSAAERCAYRRLSQRWRNELESCSARATLSNRTCHKSVNFVPYPVRGSDPWGPAPPKNGVPTGAQRSETTTGPIDAAVAPHFQFETSRKASNVHYNSYHNPGCFHPGTLSELPPVVAMLQRC